MKKTIKALVILSCAAVSGLAMAQNVTHDANHQGNTMARQIDQNYQKEQIRHDDARRIMSDKNRIAQYKHYVQNDHRSNKTMERPVHHVKKVKAKHSRHIRQAHRRAHTHHKMAH